MVACPPSKLDYEYFPHLRRGGNEQSYAAPQEWALRTKPLKQSEWDTLPTHVASEQSESPATRLAVWNPKNAVTRDVLV
ncbi:uncharacterized protein SPSK_02867 [Sporothrix schenckii 1099-18]|uniref:Uncharacterized protein n=1 Tax=Sporothrix schenckii 1099-18 TaxID=1397361 RepID=A0A0F2MDV1_SPOSC|nr:uncharacterized protein SPSK_02867 [Sporothrix schenckii 1099-18]KJR86326.1 hypothetical protein SPSK_02867 [Sporothrix schenckii 1099-18]